MSAKPTKGSRWIWASAISASVLLVAAFMHTKDIPYMGAIQTRWSIGTYIVDTENGFDKRCFTPNEGNPILSAESLNMPDVHYVADPFLVEESGRFYLFFELLRTGGGDIGVATSADGKSWTFEGAVLDEPFHLSYPRVFKWNGIYYMVPESEKANTIRLYEAVEFPHRWKLKSILRGGPALADPSIFRFQGAWWMFATVGVSELRLFFSRELEGPWQEHPQSPLVRDDPNIARSAGGVVQIADRLYRLAQDCFPSYGKSVRAFEILTLNERAYVEREVAGGPLLAASGSGWNADGMHQLSMQPIGPHRWLAVADGRHAVAPYIYLGPLRLPLPSAFIDWFRWVRREVFY